MSSNGDVPYRSSSSLFLLIILKNINKFHKEMRHTVIRKIIISLGEEGYHFFDKKRVIEKKMKLNLMMRDRQETYR